MDWVKVFRGGVCRLVDPTTYHVAVLGAIFTWGLILLLAVAVDDDSGGETVAGLIALVWSFLVWAGMWGAFAVATSRDGRTRFGEAMSGLFAQFGSFLGAAALILVMTIGAFLVLMLLALMALAGSSTAPIVALLTPLFIIGGGVVVVIAFHWQILAFGAIATERVGPAEAVSRGWRRARRALTDAALWAVGNGAVNAGILVGILSFFAFGALVAYGLEMQFIVEGAQRELDRSLGDGFFSGTDVLEAIEAYDATVQILVATTVLTIASLFNVWSAVSVGTGVTFYSAEGTGARAAAPAGGAAYPARPAAAPRFCDRCGTRATSESQFCESCGSELPVA